MNNQQEMDYRITVDTPLDAKLELAFYKQPKKDQFDLSLSLVDQQGTLTNIQKTSFQHHQLYGYGAEAPFYGWLNLEIEKLLNIHPVL